ncbi:sacsin N-terminal ATP-binding-like domain-containing protein [Nocardia ignorata]|uniref:sacsin N-terminal ATP-binding-like domain-containing protein n=1 Tax=Nocardia ignorata TaxID=145285 RepID=UPI0036394B4C
MNAGADPFGTAGLRAGVLAAWRDSPTRLREDSAGEADLVAAGYRDRVLTELAQNAADAAVQGGVPGELTVRIVDRRLHVANTGAPLSVSGVHALTALRASGKDDGAQVGRFGVGFTAVRSVGDEVEIRSTTGSIRFSLTATLNALHDNGITHPEDLTPPALRLAWPIPTTPPSGADTEVVIHLRDDIDPTALLTSMRAEAPDLLLELPALYRIRVADSEFTSVTTLLDHPAPPHGRANATPGADFAAEAAHVDTAPRPDTEPGNEISIAAPTSEGGAEIVRAPALDTKTHVGPPVGALTKLTITGPDGTQRWWQYRTARARWLLPLTNGRPVPAAPDVLRAPTRSDEELSLPAILVADIAMQPDRRRLLPGTRLHEIASGYADFARALPPEDRLVLVPTPAFARSEADALLREAIITELRTNPWLPVCPTRDRSDHEFDPNHEEFHPLTGTNFESTDRHDSPVGVDRDAFGTDMVTADVSAPDNSSVGTAQRPGTFELAEPTRSASVEIPTRASVFPDLTPELAAILADLTGFLVIPELSSRSAQEKLAVLDVHRLSSAALADLTTGLERDPHWWRTFYSTLEPFVTDSRTAEEFGALAVPLADGRLVTGPRTVVLDDQLTVAVPVHWARLVHPDATHPLLARLGARSASATDLLTDPGLRDLLEHDPADPDTVTAVLHLAQFVSADELPDWLGLLELPDDTGELRPADELLLPGAPLAEVLVDDSPFGTVAEATVAEFGELALRAIGVGWDFAVLTDPDPLGPDHDLDDESAWWNSLPEDPRELVAVRDLDLVDDTRWPQALRTLLAEPRTRALLADRDGYTTWWLHRHAHIDGIPLGRYRHPDDTEFGGLLPPFTAADPDALRQVLVRPDVMTPELAEELLDALADPSKTPTPETVSRTHARLAAAVASGALDPRELDLPEQVRTLAGTVVDAESAMVLDRPCFGLVVPAERLVVSDAEHAEALATLLDLPLVSDQVSAEVLGAGRQSTWDTEPLGVVLRQLWSPPHTTGALVLHEVLEVFLRGEFSGTVRVPWWDADGTVHVQVPRG